MKKVNIKKFSETIKNIHLTDKQRKLIGDLLMEISALSVKLNSEITIDKKVLLLPLLLMEGESTSLIEGTRSMFEDFSYDLEEMNNVPQWETRNLINLYEKYLLDDYYLKNSSLSSGFIQGLHIDLFKNDKNSKFKMTFDTSRRVEQVKPGVIISDVTKPNFIGGSNKIEDATLIMLDPSLKKEYLSDLANTLQDKIEDNSLLFDHLIISHPIFEGIHPFSDGNGRIGRILLSILFSKMQDNIVLPLYVSEAFNSRKEEYKQKLLNVQTNGDDYDAWNDWISFFIDALIYTKIKLQIRMDNIVKLFNEIKDSKVMATPIRKEITEIFFKYYKVNKPITIKRMQQKYPKVSLQTIYNDFNLVVSELKIANIGNDYYAFEKILNAIRIK